MVCEGGKLWAYELNTQKHANCTKEEVLGILQEKGSSVADYVAGLYDADLDRTSNLSVAGGTISAQQFIENIITVWCDDNFYTYFW